MPSIVFDYEDIAKRVHGDSWWRPTKLVEPPGSAGPDPVMPPDGYGHRERPCTCHPDDAPMVCQRKYATSECWGELKRQAAELQAYLDRLRISDRVQAQDQALYDAVVTGTGLVQTRVVSAEEFLCAGSQERNKEWTSNDPTRSNLSTDPRVLREGVLRRHALPPGAVLRDSVSGARLVVGVPDVHEEHAEGLAGREMPRLR